MGPHSVNLSRLQIRLHHMYHGQPYARADLNPRLESTSSHGQGLRILPQGSLRLAVSFYPAQKNVHVWRIYVQAWILLLFYYWITLKHCAEGDD
jgi:hypothetical protein